jgi:Metalloenzyme superfamily/PEP-utilising enzyme, PEP-binding domain
MLQFVRTARELARCRALIEAAGLWDRPGFELWVMAEVPSVLSNLERYAELGIAGISIGSNDLTQLLLGADRDSETLSDTFDERDPAICDYLRQLIPRACAAGRTSSTADANSPTVARSGSQRDVPTYDLKPQMSAREVTTALIDGFTERRPQFAVVNLANADMVGHTGVLAATIAAVEVVDECLARITTAVQAAGGACVITADHGNAEQMLEPHGGPSTTHSCNPVPLIVTAPGVRLAPTGTLADVAPTILPLLGLNVPAQMSGRSLLR